MTRDEVIDRRKAAKGELPILGIDEVSVTASFARDEAVDDSEVSAVIALGPRPVGHRWRFMGSVEAVADAVARSPRLSALP